MESLRLELLSTLNIQGCGPSSSSYSKRLTLFALVASFFTIASISCNSDNSASSGPNSASEPSNQAAPGVQEDSNGAATASPMDAEVETEGEYLDLAGQLLTVPPDLGEFSVAIKTFESICSGIFITPTKILTAATCLVSNRYNWGRMIWDYNTIERITRFPGKTNETIYDRQLHSVPEIFANPSFLNIYSRTGAPGPDAWQHRVADSSDGEKFFKSLSNVAVIDLSKSNRGMNPSAFANPKVAIKVVTSADRTRAILARLSPNYTTTSTRSLLLMGSGKRPSSDMVAVTSIRLPAPSQDPYAYLNFENRDNRFALHYTDALRSYPCKGDDGAPLIYQTSTTSNKTYEIIAVTASEFLSGCSEKLDRGHKFTRLDSEITADWMRHQLSCSTNCGDVDPSRVYLPTHSVFIKGNPIFINFNQPIDSSSFRTRLLMQRDGNLVAYCKNPWRVAWASGTNSSFARILTIGVWKNPTQRLIFSPIRRNAQYFRNRGTGTDYVNDYLYRTQNWPKERLEDKDLAGFGSFPVPNDNPNGSAVLTLFDDGLEMAWTSDTTSANNFNKTVLKKISWKSCLSP